MSNLFDRLKTLFEHGHREPLTGLWDDVDFAGGLPMRDAAVLIAVTEREEPGVILTHRPDTMRKHAGQVAFPGGKRDAGEDAVTTALREANEELAIDPAEVRVIGTTDRYRTGTGFDIMPVLGTLPPDLPMTPNPAEVDSWFEAPLAFLLDPANHQPRSAVYNGKDRDYLEIDWEGHRIWGVTAAIIANLSRRLAWVENA
ncbi:CoA pyrophosphatase [Qipengyuania atrilutea]|uniref:CoA pyrophosphatase n=1 Tax=Qipengyuania atrilutea TaxID=2744473 RepID=A0A850H8T8_9SPHN|nr:CoA pyrophosphatase [Actirhodobacter atriluteus]NVD45685.1 CoA pyrophosphatase [Actirhodobacter atriluteus]